MRQVRKMIESQIQLFEIEEAIVYLGLEFEWTRDEAKTSCKDT